MINDLLSMAACHVSLRGPGAKLKRDCPPPLHPSHHSNTPQAAGSNPTAARLSTFRRQQVPAARRAVQRDGRGDAGVLSRLPEQHVGRLRQVLDPRRQERAENGRALQVRGCTPLLRGGEGFLPDLEVKQLRLITSSNETFLRKT